MQGQLDPMVRHTTLGEIVGPDLLGTVSGSDLALSFLSFCIVTFCQLHLVETGTKDL